MDIVEKGLNKNKILDEFKFKLNGKKYKITLEPGMCDSGFICIYKFELFLYNYQDLELINGLINAKREFKRLKKKYCISKKLTGLERIKEFLGF